MQINWNRNSFCNSSPTMSKTNTNSSNYLQFLVMLYATFMLLTVVTCYKVISIHGSIFSVATLVVPFWYATNDIVAEIYGYSASRRLIWFGIFCQFIFVTLAYLLIHVYHSTPDNQHAYEVVFDKIPRVAISSLIASLIGSFLNIYFISKWKVLTKGRFFWFRSIGSTIIGITVFTIIEAFIIFGGTMPAIKILELIGDTLLLKLLIEPFSTTYAAIAVKIIKKFEGTDVYDLDISYSPFKLN